MSSDREKLITQLCNGWVTASTSPNGGMQVNHNTEKFRLLRNGIDFHDLSHCELRAAGRGLATVLLRPGLSTIIDADHQFFWAWCVELLAGTESDYFEASEHKLQQLLELSCRAACARLSLAECPPGSTIPQPRTECNARELITHSHNVLAYLSFPFLEGLLRKECAAFVSADGTVTSPFDVPRKGGGVTPYVVGARSPRVCSSMRDMLYLLYDKVADSELRFDLDEQRAHLRQFSRPGEDGFDVVYRWRNSSIHGEANLRTVGGTVLTIAVLIALASVAHRFDDLRSKVNMAVVNNALQIGSGYHSPWSYYPPYPGMALESIQAGK